MLNKYKSEIPEFDISSSFDGSCITVVSSNVRCSGKHDKNERNWYYRGPLLLRTLTKANADIIGFQEVKPDAFELLHRALKGYGSFIDYREECDDPEGCPIFYNLSKFAAERNGTFWLSETPDRVSKDWGAACYRICSYAVLVLKESGKKLAVFNTHLDHVSEQARIKGIKLILQKLNEFGGMPCVIMGDFNDHENSRTYLSATELFCDAKYKTADTDSGATYHEWGTMTNCGNIDYFFVSKQGIDVLQYRVIRTTYDGVYPSDHYPIKLKLNLV
ncbi:MAG: endonuclease/exonuclease/phosphatase family protein [Clostridia bacterium]|nr:endonuclease/exonuclease/phosphatase family protein [Clostridia bacterium]